MMKLKRIDGGMYCFLLTFDPSTELVNIVDLQSNSIGSLPQTERSEIQSADKKEEQEPVAETSKQKSSKILTAKRVEPLVQTKSKLEESTTPATKAKVAEQSKLEGEPPKSAREYRSHDLLSRREAAAYLGVAEQTLAIWKCTGRQYLPYLKIGKLVKYKVADLDAFLERMKHDPQNPQKQKSSGRSANVADRKLEF